MQRSLEKELIRGSQKRENNCLEILLANYDAYLKRLIGKYNFSTEQLTEVYNCAIIGLINAIDKFDLNSNCLLGTYAKKFVIGEINKFIQFELSIKKDKFFLLKNHFEVKLIRYESLLTEDNKFNDNNEFFKFEEKGFNNVENKIILDSLYKKLSEEEKKFINDIFIKRKSIKEISKEKHLSKWQIYDKKDFIIDKLRREVLQNAEILNC